MKNIIESQVEPKDSSVLWLDTSSDIKQLKTFINGKWEVINDDTKNNEQIVDTVLKKIDADFSQTIKKTDIDTYLKSSSNNPIANSVVTNNFVKLFNYREINEESRQKIFNDISSYVESIKFIDSMSIPIILHCDFIIDSTGNRTNTSGIIFYNNISSKVKTDSISFHGVSDFEYEFSLIITDTFIKFKVYNTKYTNTMYVKELTASKLDDIAGDLIYNTTIINTKSIISNGKTYSDTNDAWLNGIFYKSSNSFLMFAPNSKKIYCCNYEIDEDGSTINKLNVTDTISLGDLQSNVSSLQKTVDEIKNTHTTDITNLTTKLNTKMTVFNGGIYQEDNSSKLALITDLKDSVAYDEDGVGVCTINFVSGKFGGSYIYNANLVVKVYKVTVDNTIEIRGTVTGKYTISGQLRGTLSGDKIGTDAISYMKYYDFDLKWNTSTNKEISYTCKELNVQADLLDTLSYGVRWNSEKSSSPVCQRIGNLQMHRDLPIQNALKGCIVKYSADKKPEIQYYLDENDWRFRKDPVVLKGVTLHGEDGFYITDDVFKTLQYKNQYIKAISNRETDIYKVTDIDTENGIATLNTVSEVSTQAGSIGLPVDIELGSCLNGYDGEVMVEVPEFYIRSWERENGEKEVRISQVKIDDTWEKQPHCLISPYGITLLREVPENMGYLSTLPVNSAISVCNTETYCRGGNNSTALDQYLTTDPFRTNLGKPVTNTSRGVIRTSCRKSKNKEIMSYNQYKRICYWLYVIEYANFNSQATYNSKLDLNGFKQGGLGRGNVDIGAEWTYYNSYNPITYNGYTNSLGNDTGIVSAKVTMPKDKENTATTTYTINIPRWHGIENLFGDVWKNVDGIIINSSSITKDDLKYSEVYTTDDTSLYSDRDYESMNKVGIERNLSGYVTEFNLGNTAEIIPITNGSVSDAYKCDYHYTNQDTDLKTLFLGGAAYNGSYAGLGCFSSNYGVGAASTHVEFRSCSNFE